MRIIYDFYVHILVVLRLVGFCLVSCAGCGRSYLKVLLLYGIWYLNFSSAEFEFKFFFNTPHFCLISLTTMHLMRWATEQTSQSKVSTILNSRWELTALRLLRSHPSQRWNLSQRMIPGKIDDNTFVCWFNFSSPMTLKSLFFSLCGSGMRIQYRNINSQTKFNV